MTEFIVLTGMQGYFGNSSSIPVKGTEGGDNLYQLAKLMQLERQKSMSNPYSLWSGSGSKPDILQDPTIPQSNILPSNAPNPEFMSILQGLSERSTTSSVNSGWSNFPVQGGPIQTAYGVQQPMQAQNLPSLTNLRPQSFDNPSGSLTSEMLLSSGQDQIISLLQQQHIAQMKPQAPIPTQQLSALDEYLLLKQQQQKQEQLQLQQQQIMRQQLLSQVLTEQHSLQRFADQQSCGPMLTPGLPVGNSSDDRLGFPPHEMLQMGSHNHIPNMPQFGPQDSIRLPHQFVDNAMVQKSGVDEIGHQKEPIVLDQALNTDLRSDENIALISKPAEHYEKPLVVPSVEAVENEVLECEHLDVMEEPKIESKPLNTPCDPKEAKAVESREVKKGSEKKSKKQKSSKAQSADMAKASSKTQQSKQLEVEVTKVNEAEFEASHVEAGESKSNVVIEEPATYADNFGRSGSDTQDNTQVHSGQRAWKPAPGFKPKSLLEIQQEEQRRAQFQAQALAQAQAEMNVSDISTSLGSMNVSSPWETKKDWSTSDLRVSEVSQNQQQSKSQLHDLLAGEVAVKASEKSTTTSNNMPASTIISQQDPIEEGNFIDAKESKKSRKKAAKAKAAVAKVAVPASPEIPVSSSPNEKGKSSHKEDILPAVPSGPSFGDFVVWKGESAAPAPAPAWSTDSRKIASHTSLRDILKEQEKKGSQIPVPAQKSVSTQSNRGNGPSWSSSASSPAKAASPVQNMLHGSSQSKNKVDDDLFWGPLDHPKQEAKRYVLL